MSVYYFIFRLKHNLLGNKYGFRKLACKFSYFNINALTFMYKFIFAFFAIIVHVFRFCSVRFQFLSRSINYVFEKHVYRSIHAANEETNRYQNKYTFRFITTGEYFDRRHLHVSRLSSQIRPSIDFKQPLQR